MANDRTQYSDMSGCRRCSRIKKVTWKKTHHFVLSEISHIWKALIKVAERIHWLWENLFFDVSQITSSPIAEISHIWKALIKVAERIHCWICF
ncbi:uncharacterized protein [Palaemon carinicauda]|uniref:uncharacterized protein isoform X7 n=1 Tax=Palaemon carinicauda TaxID=392227 RepID=UPI0035B65B8C